MNGQIKNTLLTIEDINREQLRVCNPVLHLLKALKNNEKQDLQLYLLSNRTQCLRQKAENIQIQHAALWGLGRSVSQDMPEIKCKNIDFTDIEQEIGIDRLFREVQFPDNEDGIAYSGEKRFIRRLEKCKQEQKTLNTMLCHSDKTYLVTGGLGGVGLKLAEWLAINGARHIVLMSKRGLLENHHLLKELEQKYGADFTIVKADITDFRQVKQIIGEFKYPLAGVLHAAGIVKSGLLNQQNWLAFNEVLAPKTLGAWNLHVLTEKMKLDFFVNFSSISSLIGSKMLGSYCAANAFLDSFTHFRHSQGLCCLTVNWGPIAEVGMAVNQKHVFDQDVLRKAGFRFLHPQIMQSALTQLLATDVQQAVVLEADMKVLQNSFSQSTHVLDEFKVVDKMESLNSNTWIEQLRILPEYEIDQLIAGEFQLIIEKTLGIENFEIDKNFLDAGMDSLMVLEFIRSISSTFHVRMEPKLVYLNPTIQEMVSVLIEKMQIHSVLQSPQYA